MVFACCFGGGGVEQSVVVKGRPDAYGSDTIGKHGKAPEFEVPAGGAATKAGATFQSGNTTSLSAVTTGDNNSSQYQLQLLSTALAGLSGNWYERVSAAADKLLSVSGAVLCSVSILDGSHERFTVVHTTEKDSEASDTLPVGSHLPALQSVTPSSHLVASNGGGGLRYNSVQVLQLLQNPLLYSFSESHVGYRETNQPPRDWQAIHELSGFSEFCALPLTHDKSVVGAVTLMFNAPAASARPPQQGGPVQHPQRPALGTPGAPATAAFTSCDEGSMRTLALLLSVLLVGQDLQLARQVAEILAGVHEARNLQQVVTVVTAGAEQVLQLTTRMVVSINLAMLTMPPAAAGALGACTGGAGGAAGSAPSSSPHAVASNGGAGAAAGGGGGAGAVSGSGCSGRAIFFEERSGGTGSRVDGSTHGTNGSRSLLSVGEVHGSASGVLASNSNLQRSRLQRSNTPMENQANNMVSPRLRVCGSGGASMPQAPPGLRVNGGTASLSHEGTPATNSQGGLFWQGGLVQARALGLRHTLLANLPSSGTIVHDCASYMQQVGCPKRDLYLLSTCHGAPPFSLVIVPAPLRDGSDPTQLVLYVAIPMRLPMELLNEILAQAQLLAARVMAPILYQKLMRGNLADEWTLLLGCAAGKSPAAAAGVAAALGGPSGVVSSPGAPRVSTSALGGGSGGTGGQKDGRSGSVPSQPGAGNPRTGSSPSGSGASSGNTPTTPEGGSAAPAPPAPAAAPPHNGRQLQLPAGLTVAAGHMTDSLPFSTAPRNSGTAAGLASPSRVPAPPVASSQASAPTVLSTKVGGAFAGDTRTHMGMLVSSFKDTINALQAFRAEEAEELTVLKLGKVLGRGGSGLVFQGYLHLGLEVAVKLFENPDDTDPEAVSPDDIATGLLSNVDDSGTGQDNATLAAAAAEAEAAGGGDPPASLHNTAGASGAGGKDREKEKDKEKDKDALKEGARRNSSKAAAQMTKRQRDLLRNALELGVTSSLSHPNIVQGYCHWVNVVLMQDASLNRCWLMGQAEYMALAPPGSPPPPLCSALVMEYCDMGSLIHALKRGTFTNTQESNRPNMEFIYMCLLEIALALRHLHTAKLAHCDLKPGNVLLRSSPRDPRGFVCKLGDFGYAAILKEGLLPGRPAVLPDEACGTLQYMAPELFVAGRPVDASIDIYAFGMLMWELITGKTPYSDNEYGSRALMKAVYHGKRPSFPETTLQAYKNLAMCCWSGDPNLRPSATVLVKLLRQQLESLKQHSSSNSGGSGGAAGTTGTRA